APDLLLNLRARARGTAERPHHRRQQGDADETTQDPQEQEQMRSPPRMEQRGPAPLAVVSANPCSRASPAGDRIRARARAGPRAGTAARQRRAGAVEPDAKAGRPPPLRSPP